MDNKLVRDSYEFELKRKELFVSKISTPFGIWVFQATIFGYFLNNIRYNFGPIGISNYVLLVLFGISLVISVFFIFLILFGPNYSVVARGSELLKWKKSLKEYFSNENKKVDGTMYEQLEVKMADAIEINATANDKLDKSYTNLFRTLAISAFFGFATAIPHFTLKINEEYQKYHEQEQARITTTSSTSSKCDNQD
jgi:hypothetical protein